MDRTQVRLVHHGDRNPHFTIVILNLERRPDRLAHTVNQLASQGIHNYTVAYAVDGKQLQPSKWLYNLMQRNEYGSRRGVVACSLSHWSIADHLIADTTTNTYIVLEDDIELHPHFASSLDSLVKLSESLDACYLGYTLSHHASQEIKDASFSIALHPTLAPFTRAYFSGATFGYLINKTGATKLSNTLTREKLLSPIDTFDKYWKDLRMAQTLPFAVTSEQTFSNPSHRQVSLASDVQTGFDPIEFVRISNLPFQSILDSYEFFRQSDIIGHDSGRLSLNLPELLRTVHSIPSIVAVNTMGFCKHTLTKLAYIGGSFVQGIYIKKQHLYSLARPLTPIVQRPQYRLDTCFQGIIVIQWDVESTKSNRLVESLAHVGCKPTPTVIKRSSPAMAEAHGVKWPTTGKDHADKLSLLMDRHTLMRCLQTIQSSKWRNTLILSDSVLVNNAKMAHLPMMMETMDHIHNDWDLMYLNTNDTPSTNRLSIVKKQSERCHDAFVINDRQIASLLDAFARATSLSMQESMANIVHPLNNVYATSLSLFDVNPAPMRQESLVARQVTKPIRVKMMCNWGDSYLACKEFANMCQYDYRYNNIELTWTDNDIDYYVIINRPPANAVFDPKKTLVFTMEPWVNDPSLPWGVKTWGVWSRPDPTIFFHVHSHDRFLNNVQWQIDIPPVIPSDRLDLVMCVLSQKAFDKGHKLRLGLAQYVDEHKKHWLHTYGRENYHHLANYKGPLTFDRKEMQMSQYKYYFVAENNDETNYATEKIWEPILCEQLCFYWGCPNLADYIDERSFVRLPLEDPAASVAIIEQAIAEDWHAQRLDNIRATKARILSSLGFMPTLEAILQGNYVNPTLDTRMQ